ncbi:hypothetical protein OHB26_15600 [Nocardia sp. NBC_01503]|uniref:hypothetical protein n=1 Tax=Nocardia sp. NBC_01503 TaxID=2975997 RepID=UPI002E7BDDD5|nr:hypothetical protein [Nocardia sp. NBC_01503]WTL35488.1 hypothetical protein OHB26_15600 [Nocardia sp. NBC_01503]
MTAESGESQDSSDAPRPAGRRAGSRRISAADAAKLAAIFGEDLPATTKDERAPEPDSGQSGDDWLRSQVPPHHG